MNNPFAAPVLDWYARNARDLPWRDADATPWAVLVSEIMLQQTPVSRVLPAYRQWLDRWPTPADLAAQPSGEAVRQWQRLGYPRRALNLHAIACTAVQRHGGEIPDSYEALRALPGVGPYTAAAVASFAYRQRHVVLDTNVRRVLARLVWGIELPARSPNAAERELAESLLPRDGETAAGWSVAVMELGALVCTARSPRCADCPVTRDCVWYAAGKPRRDGPPRRGQTYAGTDRQVRGRLLAVLRDAESPVPKGDLDVVWSEGAQRERALTTLLADGLVERLGDDRYALPGHVAPHGSTRPSSTAGPAPAMEE